MSDHPLKQWFEQRREAGERIKKRDLAKDVGCSAPRISQIVSGDEPSLALAARLSKATGIPIDKFVKQTPTAQ